MSADKRSTHTDALATLGTIIDNTQKRDAIHLAVEPAVAGEKLYPGQHIGIEDGKAIIGAVKKLGIVDPFLNNFVPEGDRFWLIVYPRQITSLRHVWEHPEFDKAVDSVEAKFDRAQAWIATFANRVGLSYTAIMDGADNWLNSYDAYGGEYLNYGELLDGEYVPDEFWEKYEIVRGIKVDNNKKHNFFSCSC